MTETLPAKTGEAGRQIAPREYSQLKDQARMVVKSGLAPKGVNTPEQVLVIAMKGREIGVPTMQALSHIYVVDGKPTMSAELMIALVQRAGHKLRVIETDAEKCVVEGVRLDDPEYKPRLAFSMDDAKRAGVSGKGPWKSYPAAMLRARAIAALCRFAFADVLGGVSYVPEELGAAVDEGGQVVETRLDRGEPVGEAEVVEEESERCTVEQENELRALTNELFDDKSAELSGSNWLESEAAMGQKIGDLTPSRAAALIEKYTEKLEEGVGEGMADGVQ